MTIPTADDLAVILFGVSVGGALLWFVVDFLEQLHLRENPPCE